MALSQSVASELLEAFRAGEGVDLIRESVRLVSSRRLIHRYRRPRVRGPCQDPGRMWLLRTSLQEGLRRPRCPCEQLWRWLGRAESRVRPVCPLR